METRFYLHLRNILLPLLLVSSILSAQDWQMQSTADFNYYYVDKTPADIKKYDSIFRIDLFALQQKLNYHLTQSIDIFLCETPFQLNKLKEQSLPNSKQDGGVIELNSTRIALLSSWSPKKTQLAFKRRAVSILLQEMMSGVTVQDNVKSANLLHLPDWFNPGLVLYLSEGWSVDLDNQWRVAHDEYGLNNLNVLPAKFDAVKGASFWKYIDYTYGENGISTVLYMARLTRKFNSAIYYSFQESSRVVFSQWKKYYNKAYDYDQRKRNPVDGVILPMDDIMEIHGVNGVEQIFLTLESKGKDYFLYKYEQGERAKLKKLPSDLIPLEKFSGALLNTKAKPVLFANSLQGPVLYYSSTNRIEYLNGVEWINSVKGKNGFPIFLLQSSQFGSKIFEVKEAFFPKIVGSSPEVKLVYTHPGYIESFDVKWNTDKTYFFQCLAQSKNGANIIKVVDGVIKERINANSNWRNLVIANDTALLFNSHESGISNGKLLLTNSGQNEFVTNYRSNIVYHQYSSDLFCEYLDRGDFSALYITEGISVADLYTYDSIYPSYFYSMEEPNLQKFDGLSPTEIPDSLEKYTFQSPINPKHDFTLSNYDSLVELTQQKSAYNGQSTLAVDQFKTSRLTAQFFNQMIGTNEVPIANMVPVVTPNIMNIRMRVDFVNQFNTKNLGIEYVGILHPGNRDARLIYSSKGKWDFSSDFLYRQRYFFEGDDQFKFQSYVLSAGIQKKVSTSLTAQLQPQLHVSRNIMLANSENTLLVPTINNAIVKLKMALDGDFEFTGNAGLTTSAEIAPHYNVNESSLNVTAQASVKYINRLTPYLQLKSKLQGGSSLGQAPTFFVLGGTSSDFLNKEIERPFADYTNPSLYQMVFGIRGTNANHRNGTTFALLNTDLAFEPFKLVSRKPIISEVLSNFAVIGFADVATSYYGESYRDGKNVLNVTTITSPTGVLTARVNALKNPMVLGYGVGIASQFYSYTLRFDLAYSVEELAIKSSQYHLSFNLPF